MLFLSLQRGAGISGNLDLIVRGEVIVVKFVEPVTSALEVVSDVTVLLMRRRPIDT